MRLPDGLRQLLAGTLAALGFLACYVGAGLAWWLALLLGVLLYVAFLLIVQRRTPLAEVLVGEGVNAADLAIAIAALTDAAARLRQAAKRAPEADAKVFAAMAGHLDAIAENHSSDPRDYQHTRRFVTSDLPRMLEATESYVALQGRATGANRDRLAAVAERVHGFLPVLERIDQACLDNDFRELEVQIGVLSGKLDRRYGVLE